MPFSPEDLAQLGDFVKAQVAEAVSSQVAEATAEKPQVNSEAQNLPENQPDYYVHLANGKVVTSKDAGSTHMTDPDTGETVQVIGHFPVGA